MPCLRTILKDFLNSEFRIVMIIEYKIIFIYKSSKIIHIQLKLKNGC